LKKIAITLLSLLLCSPAFGAYQSAKKALSIAGKSAYGLFLVYPGMKDAHGCWQKTKEFEKLDPAVEEIRNEVQEKLKNHGFESTKIITTNNLNSSVATTFDWSYYGLPRYLQVTDQWEKFEPNIRSGILRHEIAHIENQDLALRSSAVWASGTIGHFVYSLALKSPTIRISKSISSLCGHRVIGTIAKGIAQLATVEGIRRIILDKPYNALVRAQEKRADLSVTNLNEILALAKLNSHIYLNTPDEKLALDRQHPHFLERIVYFHEQAKKEINRLQQEQSANTKQSED